MALCTHLHVDMITLQILIHAKMIFLKKMEKCMFITDSNEVDLNRRNNV